jgi:hypothetical protein
MATLISLQRIYACNISKSNTSDSANRINHLVIHMSASLTTPAENPAYFQSLASARVNLRKIAFTLVFCVAQLASKPTGWTDSEFEQLDLGDARLKLRARTWAASSSPNLRREGACSRLLVPL